MGKGRRVDGPTLVTTGRCDYSFNRTSNIFTSVKRPESSSQSGMVFLSAWIVHAYLVSVCFHACFGDSPRRIRPFPFSLSLFHFPTRFHSPCFFSSFLGDASVYLCVVTMTALAFAFLSYLLPVMASAVLLTSEFPTFRHCFFFPCHLPVLLFPLFPLYFLYLIEVNFLLLGPACNCFSLFSLLRPGEKLRVPKVCAVTTLIG